MQVLHSWDDEALNFDLGLSFGQILGVEWLVPFSVRNWATALASVLAKRHSNPTVRVPGRDKNLFLLVSLAVSVMVRRNGKHTTSHLRVDLGFSVSARHLPLGSEVAYSKLPITR